MKVPFNYQTTEYDCVPVTFINALQHLFAREEIPSSAIKIIMQYSLDNVAINKKGEHSKYRGTSGNAIYGIVQWLSSRTEGCFAFKKCECLKAEQVHLRRNNKIMSCINNGGIALMRVWLAGSFHYVLMLGIGNNDRSKILFFDPYYRVKKYMGEDSKHIEILGNGSKQQANRRVSRERLDSFNRENYGMGPILERECCLLERL